LKATFQEFKQTLALSKTTLFLVVQMIQHAVTKISMKMGEPKASLASMTMSRGCRERFQCMERKFRQSELKGHSKKRWKLVSTTELLQITQL